MFQVLLTVPGKMTVEEFSSHLSALSALGCEFQFNNSQSARTVSKKSDKIKVITSKDRLTKHEETILDQGLEVIHKRGISPLLDSMTAKGIGRLKPNMSQEIISYYRENPGHTTALGAGFLAEKHTAHYQDVNDAFKRIRNLINTMAHSKGTQKSLEKRGGFPGRGGDSQVYVVEGV